MELNANNRLVSASTLAKHCAQSSYFRKGYESALKDQPFDYNIENTRDAYYYTRGRSFAIYCKQLKQPRAVWRKNILAKTAQERVIQAFRYGYLF